MKLLVGLGNPGQKYEKNRHNIWFMSLDALVQAEIFSWDFSYNNKFAAEILDGYLWWEKVVLMKPMLFMNKSGSPVKQVMDYYKLSIDDVLVLHDEIDHKFWSVKLKSWWWHAWHNGLRNIIEYIWKDFYRIRVGVNHPGHKDAVSDYVLSDFSKKEKDSFDGLFVNINECILAWINK